MTSYVLVHGSWQAGWVWNDVAEGLRERGHDVTAPDLPGHGRNTVASEVGMDSYVDYLAGVLRECSGRRVLVGHSHGGLVITRLADEHPDLVDQLVYVGAFLPGEGESLVDVAQRDTESEILPAMIFSADHRSATLDATIARTVLFSGCDDRTATDALGLLEAEPTATMTMPITRTESHWGSIPRAYVVLAQDRGLAPWLQRQMAVDAGCDPVLEISSGHMVSLEAPAALAETLGQL